MINNSLIFVSFKHVQLGPMKYTLLYFLYYSTLINRPTPPFNVQIVELNTENESKNYR